jgi:hypothetical protein
LNAYRNRSNYLVASPLATKQWLSSAAPFDSLLQPQNSESSDLTEFKGSNSSVDRRRLARNPNVQIETVSQTSSEPQFKEALSILLHRSISGEVHRTQFPFSMRTVLFALDSLSSNQSLSLLTYNDLKSLIFFIGSYAFQTRPDNFQYPVLPIKLVNWLPELDPSVNEHCWRALIKLISIKQQFQDPLDDEDILWLSYYDCMQFESKDSQELQGEMSDGHYHA